MTEVLYPVPDLYFQYRSCHLWRCALQHRPTIFDLSDDQLMQIARDVSLPHSMEIVHTKFWKLKLSKYQRVAYYGNNTESIQRVFNQKRSHIHIYAAPYCFDITTSVCNELASNAWLMNINLSRNNLYDKDVKHIATGISDSASLKSIDIGKNHIGKDMALQLVEIFKKKQMISVGLAACDLDADGAQAVANYISVSTSLTKVLACCR